MSDVRHIHKVPLVHCIASGTMSNFNILVYLSVSIPKVLKKNTLAETTVIYYVYLIDSSDILKPCFCSSIVIVIVARNRFSSYGFSKPVGCPPLQ